MMTVKINRKTISAETLVGLRDAFRAYIEERHLGGSQCRGGDVYGWKISGADRPLDISYNGRVWEGGDRGKPWTPGCRAEVLLPVPGGYAS